MNDFIQLAPTQAQTKLKQNIDNPECTRQWFGQYFISCVSLLKSERFSSLTCLDLVENGKKIQVQNHGREILLTVYSTQHSDCDSAVYTTLHVLCTFHYAICTSGQP